jgi:predicted amidohydrolase
MTRLRIALIQLTAHGTDQDANLAKGEAACRAAREMGADIALFPEMWNIGYTPFFQQDGEPPDLWRAPELWNDVPPESEVGDLLAARSAWQARAIDRDGPFVTYFRHLARELEMAIGITYLERWPGAPRNTVSLIDRHGDIVLTYAKVHNCDFSPLEDALTPGDAYPVCSLDTGAGNVHLGAMICFDREFPESARALMLGGAEIILVPNACDMEMHRTGQLRARAWENLVGIALANYAAPQINGHSVAFDPIAFDRDGSSRDTLIVEAGEPEEIVLADFDLDALRAARQREVWGGAFRRTDTYSVLTESAVTPPFVRVDRAGRQWSAGADE